MRDTQARQVRWETCEIVCIKSNPAAIGKNQWEFRAEAVGPNGHYWASPPYLTHVNPHANFDQISKESINYIRYVVVSLVRALTQDGWEPLDIFGSHWYSHRFRRKIKTP